MNEKYLKVFIDTFNVSAEQANSIAYQSIPDWDSVGHMQLITMIEATFNVTLSAEDIIDFSSFEKGKEILEKYGVEF